VRVLLDEQLPRQLARHLQCHDVRTVHQQSWAGLKNGALLSEAEQAGFSVFITGDRNLEHQQNLTQRKLGVVVLAAASNALEDLLPLIPETLTAIENVRPGQVFRVPERPPAG
jgi:predicted nuclease of predicted toxin-antitoxin system